MKVKKSLLLIPMVSMVTLADVPPGQVGEVEHLVNFIRNTDCRLERNEKIYSGNEVIEHILRKYDYYREEINSTEDFIEFSASKSVMSGKPYLAHCNNRKPVSGREWLLKELNRYRESVKAR